MKIKEFVRAWGGRLVGLLAIVVLFLPMATPVYAEASYHDPSGTYTMGVRYRLDGLDLVRGDRYTEVVLVITDESSGVLTGTLAFSDLVGLATGKLVRGSGRFNEVGGRSVSYIYLDSGANTIECSRAGTCTITLPTGVTGTAATGTATVTESPVSLLEATATEVTLEGTGNFTVTLVGATLTDGTGTFTDSPITLDEGANEIACTSTGTAIIALPAGVTGTATSGTSVVTNSPVALVPGDNTITVTAAEPGVFDVTVVTTTAVTGYIGDGTGNTKVSLYTDDDSGVNFVLNGRIYMRGANIYLFRGALTGYFVPLSGSPAQFSTRGSGYYVEPE